MGARSPFKYPIPSDLDVDNQRMMDLVEDYWRRNRTAVSPATDELADWLADEMGAEMLEVECGEEILTWKVPKRWEVRRGQLRTKEGDVIADFDKNPLFLWTHSISKQGVVSKSELLNNHICTAPNRPNEIPYHYRNGFRYQAEEWGFCLPYSKVTKMTDDEYMVDIDADLDSDGVLKVVDVCLPGRRDETIFFGAHTCHPAQVSDGIANIAVARELYNLIAGIDDRRYTYRFIFGPEYYGGAAFLDRSAGQTVDSLLYGIYLDFLSSNEPIGYQTSRQGNTRIDDIVHNVLEYHRERFVEERYRGLVGNDEAFYNGPGFNIPTVGVARSVHREYHYSSDNIDNMNLYHMREAVWLLYRIVQVLETDCVPSLQFNGPLYQSRYLSPGQSEKIGQKLDEVHALADGRRSCCDIASVVDMDYFDIYRHFKDLETKELVCTKARPDRADDFGGE